MALALSSRQSTVAAITSAVAAVAIAVAVAGHSCRVSQPGPEEAVRDLLHAAKAGDRDTVYALLSPSTHAQLEVEAQRATGYVASAVRYSAKDLVSLGNTEGIAAPAAITVVEEQGDRARVLVISVNNDRSHIDLVRIDGLWRIHMPMYGPIE